MAGDWIKMRGNLWDDPRVSNLCDLTDSTESSIVGGLYWLWATADQHSQDGFMPGLTLRQIDRKTGINGFGNALCSIGWIQAVDRGVNIIRFEEHNGASAKKRSVTAKRVADHRGGNADVTPPALQDGDASVTGALARERVREEVTTPNSPQGGKPRGAIALQTYLDECKQSGKKPIPEGHGVFEYADKAGIPADFLRLQWLEFKSRYCQPDAKRYKSWPTVFNKSVQGNWFRLWYAKDGGYLLTTTGEQARQVHREAA